MNPENNIPGLDLATKYLAGEASPEEAMELEDWLKIPENKTAFDQLLRLWQQIPGTSLMQVPPSEEAWQEVQQQHLKKRFFIRRYFAPVSIAASLVGVILVLIAVLPKSKPGTKQVAQTTPHFLVQPRGDSILTAPLPDGSHITLLPNSSLQGLEGFNLRDRKVKLAGEGFFEVKPDRTKPFIISIEDLKITVVGTAFNVSKDSLSGNIIVQVQSGIVRLTYSNDEILVKKGQTGIYSRKEHRLYVQDEIDPNSLGYVTKTFSFNDLSLVQACRYLQKAFGVKIQADSQKYRNCRITAHFKEKQLDYILDVMCTTLNLQYTKQNNTYLIHGDSCQ